MRTLLEYAVANAAAATALALVALVVGLVVRRPAVRHALWVLVLVRLVLPPVWTVPVPVPVEEPEPAEIASAIVDPTPPVVEPADVGDWPVVFDLPAADLPAAEVVAGPAAAVEAAPAPFPVYAVIGGVWAAGCGFVFARSAWRVCRFRRALRDARPAPDAIQHQAAELATAMGLRRCPTVLVVPARVWPSLWMPGFLPRQAQVLLPAGLVSILDPSQRAAVLARTRPPSPRRPVGAVAGSAGVRTVLVVPLVVWFRRHLRASEEACCDLWVVAALGGRRAYATALVETAAYLGGRTPWPRRSWRAGGPSPQPATESDDDHASDVAGAADAVRPGDGTRHRGGRPVVRPGLAQPQPPERGATGSGAKMQGTAEGSGAARGEGPGTPKSGRGNDRGRAAAGRARGE